jgi:hypothetical protein
MLASSALLLLAACQQSREPAAGITELAWARVALERNPSIEVVATDIQTGVFTIRDKRTGQIQAVKLSELAAAPISLLAAPISRSEAPAATVAPSVTESAPADAHESAETRVAVMEKPPTDAGPAESAGPAKAAAGAEAKDYTIERADGQVKVSGPGISIVSSRATATSALGAEPGLRKAEPIICEGPQMIHLDNRRIYVDGDGVTVRAGCELYLTNSRIVASGTGVVVQDAVVHISNSYIEGASGSFEAAIGARMFVRDSSFNGLSRRDAFAQVEDQGGNEWH